MKESISYTFLLNIIITFIVISFFVIMCIMSYTKAFRVNSKIVNAIEIAEGYNGISKEQIDIEIENHGYQKFSIKCPEREGQYAVDYNENHRLIDDKTTNGICVYKFYNNSSKKYSYGVMTYMTFDFPIISSLVRIPVYTRTMTMHDLD